MDTLKDLWASLNAGVRDRTTNPLTVAFIISWSLWNYRFFLILFGDEKTPEKLVAIDKLYPHDPSIYMGGALLYPIFTAMLYVYFYPIIGMTGVWAYRTYQVWTADLVKRVEKTRTLSKQEADELTRRHERERKKWENESVSLGHEIASLREALSAAETEVVKLKTKMEEPLKEDGDASTSFMQSFVDNLPSPSPSASPLPAQGKEGEPRELSASEVSLLAKLSNYSFPVSGADLSTIMGKNFTLVEADLKSLKESNLVSQTSSAPPKWYLTEQGKKVVVAFLKRNPKLAE